MAGPMEFWGVEIKGGKPQKVEVEIGELIHLSHATLGELKKGAEPVVLSVTVGGQKLNLGVLSVDNAPQLSFDLVFEKDFELSHNCKNGSVHLLGYKSVDVGPEDDGMSEDSLDGSGEMALPTENKEKSTGKAAALPTLAKPKTNDTAADKGEEKIKEESDEDDESEDDDDDESEDDDESDDEEMLNGEDDSDEDDDSEEDESDEEDEAVKVADAGKKRPASATKTPEAKKAKLTSQKTDGKRSGGGHAATPHPAKKAGKTPASDDKSNVKPPKSAGHLACGSCKRTLASDNALQAHMKAKHSGK